MLNPHSAFQAKRSGEYRLQKKALCQLTTTGALGACDPLTEPEVEPFARAVPEGSWPVDVLLAEKGGDTRVALARIRFGDTPPVRFALALVEGRDVRAAGSDETHGYGVDSGTGCFADAPSHLPHDELLGELEQHQEPTWSWACSSDESCVAFSSGYGDGVYASYFGLDEANTPVCLVTDFQVLELELPRAAPDTAFRQAEAKRLAEALLKGFREKQRANELDAIIEHLLAVGESAGGTLPPLLEALVQANGQREELLAGLVAKLILASGALDALAAFVPRLDTNVLARILAMQDEVEEGRPVPASLAAALEARWQGADLPLRVVVLELLGRASPLPDSFARLALDCANAILRTPEEADAGRAACAICAPYAALSAKGKKRRTPRYVAPAPLVERMPSLARIADTFWRTRTILLSLSVQGHDGVVMELLDDADLRPMAAMVLVDLPTHRERASSVLLEAARDARFSEALRCEAVSAVPHGPARCDAALELGLLGFARAPVSLCNAPEEFRDAAIAALDLLASEAKDSKVRYNASVWAEVERKRAAKKRQRIS